MDWLHLKDHGMLVDFAFVLSCLLMSYYFSFCNTKYVLGPVKDRLISRFLAEHQEDDIVDIPKMSTPLRLIPKVEGHPFLLLDSERSCS